MRHRAACIQDLFRDDLIPFQILPCRDPVHRLFIAQAVGVVLVREAVPLIISRGELRALRPYHVFRGALRTYAVFYGIAQVIIAKVLRGVVHFVRYELIFTVVSKVDVRHRHGRPVWRPLLDVDQIVVVVVLVRVPRSVVPADQIRGYTVVPIVIDLVRCRSVPIDAVDPAQHIKAVALIRRGTRDPVRRISHPGYGIAAIVDLTGKHPPRPVMDLINLHSPHGVVGFIELFQT